MTRKQTYGFAAIATAALSIAGTWSLVHAQQAAQVCLRRLRSNVTEVVQHSRLRIQLFVLVLREVIDIHVVPKLVCSRR